MLACTHFLALNSSPLFLLTYSDERSVQCGAIDPTRPSACCEGLICDGKKCVDPNIAPPASELSCATEGIRSQQCGATRSDLPVSCCEGLVCEDALVGVKCVMPSPGGEPVSEPAVGDSTCAASGVRSQQCGATRSDLPATCCEGLVCEGNGSVKCAEEAAETSEPTKAPVEAPEPTKAPVVAPEPTMGVDPTDAPDMIELDPTGEPTPDPTGVEVMTTSSASAIAAKAALVTAVAVPMLFFF